MTGPHYPLIRVDHDRRGDWEVELPDAVTRVRCRSLAEARHIAFRHAADSPRCELVICDAYHRVAHHELVDPAL